ncbi:hypothetical protein CAOG_02535 [Capsaspora owczarzaki ATCC 30864]|uniref:Cytochrome c oxidase assembly factor 6 n=1 Tax=Capsaspora owczarzaki (strain ATCC 30864) TaxID=595528 RepID=A0A0D2X1U1_CAPO3|nr:hypothetical protein CAOG_02535 [Capsaspora owczarzaki ATCC 30864]KJE91399.1 hypothetical protein CAOG_002535 [Capsaspora owczarzaki ATCC 30864]|eukprot:XP_004349285.1 hypothetical protein CAOG_02535 [Capsaspora owczarzaki ATCC 30864]
MTESDPDRPHGGVGDSPPAAADRKKCYAARDAYYECAAKNIGNEASACSELRRALEGSCLPSWVRYFDRKVLYEDYKRRLAEEERARNQEQQRR